MFCDFDTRRAGAQVITQQENNLEVPVVHLAVGKRKETSGVEKPCVFILQENESHQTPVIAWASGITQTNNPWNYFISAYCRDHWWSLPWTRRISRNHEGR